jgi:hypothetical protein
LGYEICLHCVAPETSSEVAMEAALEYMQKTYDTVSWIDHFWYRPDGVKSGCLESFCCEGLRN